MVNYREWVDRELYDVEFPTPEERACMEQRGKVEHERAVARDLEWRRREAVKARAMDEHERMMATDADYYRDHRRIEAERAHDEMLNREEL